MNNFDKDENFVPQLKRQSCLRVLNPMIEEELRIMISNAIRLDEERTKKQEMELQRKEYTNYKIKNEINNNK